MEELLDLVISDESPSQISDKIKEILFAKSSERIDSVRPEVANGMFGFDNESEDEQEQE
jgi:hypothetical protein